MTEGIEGKGLLTGIQRDCLALLSTLADQDQFYLTGGTALAEFFLAHRLSYDLDYFTTEDNLILPFSRRVESAFRDGDWGVNVVRRFATYVEFRLESASEALRVDLALDSPCRFQDPRPSEYGVLVNDYTDLKTEKVLAYYGRAEPRDAVDLYFILRRDSLDDLMALAAQKDPGFDRYWFAVALHRARAFPEELERWPVTMVAAMDPVQLKEDFEEMALQVMAQVKPERGAPGSASRDRPAKENPAR